MRLTAHFRGAKQPNPRLFPSGLPGTDALWTNHTSAIVALPRLRIPTQREAVSSFFLHGRMTSPRSPHEISLRRRYPVLLRRRGSSLHDAISLSKQHAHKVQLPSCVLGRSGIDGLCLTVLTWSSSLRLPTCSFDPIPTYCRAAFYNYLRPFPGTVASSGRPPCAMSCGLDHQPQPAFHKDI